MNSFCPVFMILSWAHKLCTYTYDYMFCRVREFFIIFLELSWFYHIFLYGFNAILIFYLRKLTCFLQDLGQGLMLFEHYFHILKFGVPTLGICKEIIKNVSSNYQSVVTTLNKTINNILKCHFLLLLQNKIQICSFFTLD